MARFDAAALRAYAVSRSLFPPRELEAAMREHVLEHAELVGLYER